MVGTRGKKIKFDLDSPELELDDESDVERPGRYWKLAVESVPSTEGPSVFLLTAKPLAKRRKTKRFKSGEDDHAFTPGSSPGKRKAKTTLVQNQLITRRSGKSGKLRELMNMPIDIFTEVCYSESSSRTRLIRSLVRFVLILIPMTFVV